MVRLASQLLGLFFPPFIVPSLLSFIFSFKFLSLIHRQGGQTHICLRHFLHGRFSKRLRHVSDDAARLLVHTSVDNVACTLGLKFYSLSPLELAMSP